MRLRPALLAVLLLPGCAVGHSAPAATVVPPPPPPVTLDEALAAYEAYCAGITTLSASGDLDVRDQRTGKARSLGVRLVASRGGRLYLKGSVAVVTALEVVANGEHFWFQVPSKKTVWTGSAQAGPDRESGAEEGAAPYYALRPADVLRALLPEPLAPEALDTVTMESDARVVSLALSRLERARGPVRRRVGLSRPSLRPAFLRDYDAQGELQSEILLSGWTDERPHVLEVRRPRDGYEARLRLDKLQVNVAVPERAFVPRTPPEYKTVEVR
jgi:hypothetical protein